MRMRSPAASAVTVLLVTSCFQSYCVLPFSFGVRLGAANGPIVCDGVIPGIVSLYCSMLVFVERRRIAAAQHNIEAIRQRPFRHGILEIELADHPAARLFRRRAED